LVQHADSLETSPVQVPLPLPPSPPPPIDPLVPLVLEVPAAVELPPDASPPDAPLPPADLPALPADDVPAAAPHVASALQSSAELLQADSCTTLIPRTSASAEKAEIRM